MPTILIADDEPDILLLLSFILRQQKFEVNAATSKEEFEKQFELSKPDLIILDIQLGIHDGREICSKIKNFNADLPVILMSARPDLLRNGGACKADAVIEKPFAAKQLINTIKELLSFNKLIL